MSIWRLLLLCTLALALPVQGWSAAARLHCITAAGPDAQALHGPAPTAPLAGEPGDGGHDCTGAAHAAAIDDSDAAAPHGAHSCSACAACSPAVGLPTPGVQLPALPSAGQAVAATDTAGPSHVPARLERPPRR